MKQKIQIAITSFLIISSTLSLQSFSKPGGDFYRIYLNDKLLVEQFLHAPKEFRYISLNKDNSDDYLIIHYSHCGLGGKSRVISLKDEKGNNLKNWKFEDAKSTGMRIAVKEILKFSNGKTINIYYTSKELSTGLKLTSLISKSSLAKF